MAAVLQLVTHSNKDTVVALEYLLHEAKRGKRVSVAGVFRIDADEEEALFTGTYRVHPDQAVSASLRLSMIVMKASGELDRAT